MTPKIGKRDGGSGATKGHASKGASSDEELMQAMRDELDDLRAKHAALLAKLDADGGVTGTDYASTLALPDARFTK